MPVGPAGAGRCPIRLAVDRSGHGQRWPARRVAPARPRAELRAVVVVPARDAGADRGVPGALGRQRGVPREPTRSSSSSTAAPTKPRRASRPLRAGRGRRCTCSSCRWRGVGRARRAAWTSPQPAALVRPAGGADREHRRRHVVAPDWLWPARAARRGASAIGGLVELRRARAAVGCRAAGARVAAGERLRAAMRAADPGAAVEHHHFSGASLSLTARAYRRCGGLRSHGAHAQGPCATARSPGARVPPRRLPRKLPRHRRLELHQRPPIALTGSPASSSCAGAASPRRRRCRRRCSRSALLARPTARSRPQARSMPRRRARPTPRDGQLEHVESRCELALARLGDPLGRLIAAAVEHHDQLIVLARYPALGRERRQAGADALGLVAGGHDDDRAQLRRGGRAVATCQYECVVYSLSRYARFFSPPPLIALATASLMGRSPALPTRGRVRSPRRVRVRARRRAPPRACTRP